MASLAWTALTAKDRSVSASIALMRAHSIQAGREAAREYLAPSLNLTMADHELVALQMAGAAPARLAGHTSQGRIPAPGWLAVNDWQGMRPFDANPWVVDPPSGIVVNTNNRITDAAFPDHLSFDWGDSPGSSGRASSSATGSIIRWTASWRSRPTSSPRRRGCSCR